VIRLTIVGQLATSTFSHDSTRPASASNDKTVKIWDAISGTCLHTLQIDETLSRISFSATGSFLYTEIGSFSIDASPPSTVS